MRQLPTVDAPVIGFVQLPGSKSLTNRLLILAALSAESTRLYHPLWSDDTRVMLQALHQLGAQIDGHTDYVDVRGPIVRPNQRCTVYCGQAGTVARLLLPVCVALGGRYTFQAQPQLVGRPLDPLLKTLQAHGMALLQGNERNWPLQVAQLNGLSGGQWRIAAQQSSQFLSGLMLAALQANKPVTLRATTPWRKPYVFMTQSAIRQFGGQVDFVGDSHFDINPYCSLSTPGEITVEPDASTASYFLAAAAITGGQVTLNGVDPDNSTQGDWQFLNILERMGCHIRRQASSVTVKCGEYLRGIDVDMQQMSDTFMTLAAIAPYAEGPTLIRGIGHVRQQECDRISAVAQQWQHFGIHIETGPDWLKINPFRPPDSTNNVCWLRDSLSLSSRSRNNGLQAKDNISKTRDSLSDIRGDLDNKRDSLSGIENCSRGTRDSLSNIRSEAFDDQWPGTNAKINDQNATGKLVSSTEKVVVNSHGDHRLAMALAVLALKRPGVVLQDSEVVSKTCPDFWQRWHDLLGV